MTYVTFNNPYNGDTFHGLASNLKINRKYSRFTIVYGGVTTNYKLPTFWCDCVTVELPFNVILDQLFICYLSRNSISPI